MSDDGLYMVESAWTEKKDVPLPTLEPPCEHLQLSLTWNLVGSTQTYQCVACKKKITISMFHPALMTRSHYEAQENFSDMIELAFGPTWGKLAREGKL